MTEQLSLFYNTNQTEGLDLFMENIKAHNQGEVLLFIFKQHRKLTPSQATEIYVSLTGKHNTPITSIRRAITDLKIVGKIEKTTDMHLGLYGKPEHFYKLI